MRRNSSSEPSISTSHSNSPEPSTSPKIHEGCIAINKPAGITSAQVLRDLQKHFTPSALFAPLLEAERQSRIRESEQARHKKKRLSNFQRKLDQQVKLGHGGTLDPAATGVLIVGIGKGTKELSRFLDCTKSYECVMLFGAATDTYDAEGKMVGRKPFAHITRELVEEKLGRFRGKIMQKPPLYSALSVQGKRLYEYAREGLEVPIEIQERPMEVSSLEIVEWMEGGKHDFKWPKEEAETMQKVVGEKVLGLKDEEKLSTTEEPDTSADLDTKRKRSESGEMAVEGPPDAKHLKSTSDQHTMAGALATAWKNEIMSPKPNQREDCPSSQYGKPPAVRIKMTVSSGFYVRSFCQDLGVAVDSLALMSSLVRSRQQAFSLANGLLEYSDLDKGEGTWGPKVEAMLADWNKAYNSTRKHRERSP